MTTPPPLTALARLLIEAQTNQRLSISALADRIGCHRSLLYRWLGGECRPQKKEHLQSIAQVCGQSVAFIQELISPSPLSLPATPSRKTVRQSLLRVQNPLDLPAALTLLAEDVFQIDQLELYLAGLETPLPYMWRAGAYPGERAEEVGSAGEVVPLFHYVTDWSAFTPKSQNDLIARAFATRQMQEVLDVRFLSQLGIAAHWLLVAPFVHEQQCLGCLVLKSAARGYLTTAEAALVKEACRCLAPVVVEHTRLFDRMGMHHTARMLLTGYQTMLGQELPLTGNPPQQARLLETLARQASTLGSLLLSLAQQLRYARLRFNDLSIQQIDSQTGTMLAIGTQQGKRLLPPALFDATTAVPCWEAFQSGKPIYRPDLSKSDPYGECDRHSHQPVLAILDVPFKWGEYQGTLGVNSLDPNPWAERDLKKIAGFVRRFRPEKTP